MTVGAVLHNIETRRRYDFLTWKCAILHPGIVDHRVTSQHSATINALEQTLALRLFNRRVTAATLRQGKIFIRRSAICCNSWNQPRTPWWQRLRSAKVANSRCAHSLRLTPSIISQMPPLFTPGQFKAIDVDGDKLREEPKWPYFSFHDEDLLSAVWPRLLNLNCSRLRQWRTRKRAFRLRAARSVTDCTAHHGALISHPDAWWG